MHAVTESVRAQYERYPYPLRPPALRIGSDARLLLGFGRLPRPGGRPIRVLDAGCGRGVGLIGCATLQPDVEFTGIDLCRASLDHARQEVASRGLENVRLAEVDLMSLAGLELPEGGFDVVLSSGVLHHLVDPVQGLRRLVEVLAPHGILSLMVYGRRGREALYRLMRAADVLVSREAPLEERLAVARTLVREVRSEPLLAGPWQDQLEIDDSEFVDRYLNVHETSYDVPGLLELVAAGGMEFLRWVEPADWSVEALLPSGATRERALALDEPQRWQLVDELFWRPSFELLLCKPGNGPRPTVKLRDLIAEPLAFHPEVRLITERRNLRGLVRTERLQVQVRDRAPVPIPGGAAARALLLLADQTTAFRCGDLVAALGADGFDVPVALTAIADLMRLGVFYRPHPVDA